MIKPKDIHGNELREGEWYWVRDENSRTKGVGLCFSGHTLSACQQLVMIGFCDFNLQRDDPQGLWQFEPVQPPSWEGK